MVDEALIIGIDCATRAENVGLAVATFTRGRVRVASLAVGDSSAELARDLAPSIVTLMGNASPVVIAIDAPLGWPADLSDALREHRAGERLGTSGDVRDYVSRLTDREVHRLARTKPLDVGADLIARTAFAALELLAELRAKSGHPLPLLWGPGEVATSGAIEVYPKATFRSRGLVTKDYKSAKSSVFTPPRQALVAGLAKEIAIPDDLRQLAIASDHALDAVGCVLAGKDFLEGNVVRPKSDAERALAEREGWIWFREPAE